MFWLTPQTVRSLYGSTYHAWNLFDSTHLFWLGLTLVLTILVWTCYPRLSVQTKRRLMIAIAVLMIADELFKDIPSILTGQFILQYLPFHLCSVNIFVVILNTLKENRYTKAILACICIPAALCALIMPNWVCLPIWNFMHLHSEIIHILLFIYPMMILADGYRPGKDMIPMFIGYVVGLALFDKALNALLGTNFLFLTHNENNPALILIQNLFGSFYNVGIIVLLLALCILMIGFWNLFRPRKMKQA